MDTRFSDAKGLKGEIIRPKLLGDFFGTVPTFGFRISMVENGRSQNFIKLWLTEVGKF